MSNNNIGPDIQLVSETLTDWSILNCGISLFDIGSACPVIKVSNPYSVCKLNCNKKNLNKYKKIMLIIFTLYNMVYFCLLRSNHCHCRLLQLIRLFISRPILQGLREQTKCLFTFACANAKLVHTELLSTQACMVIQFLHLLLVYLNSQTAIQILQTNLHCSYLPKITVL